MIYRSVTLGLLSALIVLVAARPGVVVVHDTHASCARVQPPPPPPPIRRTALAAQTMLVDVPRSAMDAFLRAPWRAGRGALVVHNPAASGAGVRVVEATPGGMIAALGLRADDVVVRVNDVPVLSRETLETARVQAPGRDYYDIDVVRAGRKVRIVVLVHAG